MAVCHQLLHAATHTKLDLKQAQGSGLQLRLSHTSSAATRDAEHLPTYRRQAEHPSILTLVPPCSPLRPDLAILEAILPPKFAHFAPSITLVPRCSKVCLREYILLHALSSPAGLKPRLVLLTDAERARSCGSKSVLRPPVRAFSSCLPTTHSVFPARSTLEIASFPRSGNRAATRTPRRALPPRLERLPASCVCAQRSSSSPCQPSTKPITVQHVVFHVCNALARHAA